MSVMHFKELNSTVMVSCCPGCDLDPLTPPLSPIPNHAKIDVPEAHPSRSGATKARWDPQGTPKGGWGLRYGSYGASVACSPLVLRQTQLVLADSALEPCLSRQSRQ